MFVRQALLAGFAIAALASSAGAQSWMGAGPYGYQPAQPAPYRPLPSNPFMYYDLLGGFARNAITAPQPIGHEHIATGPNGYIYQPVYAAPLAPPRPPLPPQAAPLTPPRAPSPPNAVPPAQGPRQLNDSPRPAPAPLPEPNPPQGPRAF
jgi:hypothetical protein